MLYFFTLDRQRDRQTKMERSLDIGAMQRVLVTRAYQDNNLCFPLIVVSFNNAVVWLCDHVINVRK